MGKIKNSIAITLFVLISTGCGLVLTGCGDNNSGTGTVSTSTAHGTLIDSPPFRIASLTAAEFAAELGATASGMQLLEVAGTPVCGVDFYYIQYYTLGGAGEATNASGALMVPTGGAGCSGARPIVLYAHGTAAQKNYNIANIADPTNPAYDEAALIAAVYAAQGFIVVAPNYAGYDISALPYHPWLNGNQQSGEMLDALAAARTALPTTFAASTTDSGQLLLTGYSQGGYVALATMRALEAAGQAVTAAAPGSGPYALEQTIDAILFGATNAGAQEFLPLLTTSYQYEFGNIYSATTDIYASPYATGIATQFPGASDLGTLIGAGTLPPYLFDSTTPSASDITTLDPAVPAPLAAGLAVELGTGPPALPSTNPIFAAGFGTPFLLNNSARILYGLDTANSPDLGAGGVANPAPVYPLRHAIWANDLRNPVWAPNAPLFMCGGTQDPTVFFTNAETMSQFWSGLPAGVVTVYSVDPTDFTNAPDAVQTAFLQAEGALYAAADAAAGGGAAGAAAGELAVVENYHAGLVPPFCAAEARGFFLQVLGG